MSFFCSPACFACHIQAMTEAFLPGLNWRDDKIIRKWLEWIPVVVVGTGHIKAIHTMFTILLHALLSRIGDKVNDVEMCHSVILYCRDTVHLVIRAHGFAFLHHFPIWLVVTMERFVEILNFRTLKLLTTTQSEWNTKKIETFFYIGSRTRNRCQIRQGEATL